ncbi:MAG: TonB-dependent receptor plug domain-containing protein [Spirosomataceae bacterium]
MLNPQSCTFSGYIVSKRLANMLPLDFEMPLTSYPMPPQEWDKQTETPLFNLDRPYYFSKDKIGIKGIMQYQNPAFGDSLSGVLYIDVVNAITQKVVVKQPVKIHQGFFETQISFSDSVAIATPYWIRAYTQWMLNFGDSSYAFREIGVIPEGYNLKHEQKWENSGNIPLSLSVYSNSVEDSVEILLPASVQNKVLWATVAVRNKQIVGSNMDYWSAPHFGAFKPLYQPAKTLHVAGRMLKPTIRKAGSAILFFPRQGATFFANIVANGTFRFDNIEIDSTQEAIFQFNDAKGNPIENPKVVFDDPPTPQWLPTVLEKKKEAQMVVEKIQNNWPREGVLLEEVTVKSSKVIRPLQSIYKEADYVVQGKDLFDKAVGTNILTAIQGRVPGLRIVEFPDEVGLPKLVLTMRMGASVGGFNKTTLAQPLVLVDGIPFENINQLANLSPTIVERIEVVNRAEALLGLRGYVGVISVITKNGLKNGNFTTTSASSMTQKTIMGYISPSSTPFWQVLDTSKPLKIRKPSYPFYVVVEGVTYWRIISHLSQ